MMTCRLLIETAGPPVLLCAVWLLWHFFRGARSSTSLFSTWKSRWFSARQSAVASPPSCSGPREETPRGEQEGLTTMPARTIPLAVVHLCGTQAVDPCPFFVSPNICSRP